MKKLINGTEQTNNLAPIKYTWAWKMYQASLANHWTPQEIPMGGDKACYLHTLNQDERHLFHTVFATLTSADMAILKNLAISVFERLTAPEVQLYVARQIAEEAIHSHSYQHVIELLGLDEDEIYSLYERVPEIKQKFDLGREYAEKFEDNLLEGLVFYYCCWEGIWFMGGFPPILSLVRRNLMTGTGGQLNYIMRDEAAHTGFGVKLIREICNETGQELDVEMVHSVIHDAILAEQRFAEYAIPSVLGYNADLHIKHCKYLADRRLKSLWLPTLYDQPQVLPWLSEVSEIKKEQNFFETRVTEYQVSANLDFVDDGSIEEIVNWKE